MDSVLNQYQVVIIVILIYLNIQLLYFIICKKWERSFFTHRNLKFLSCVKLLLVWFEVVDQQRRQDFKILMINNPHTPSLVFHVSLTLRSAALMRVCVCMQAYVIDRLDGFPKPIGDCLLRNAPVAI